VDGAGGGAPTVTREGGGLRRDVLSARHVAIMAMAATGPAAVIALNYGPMASFAGPGFVLSFVLTLVAVLLLTNALVQFSHRYPSAGSLYTWGVRAFGKNFGFVFGWLFAGSYILLAAAGFVVLGGWGEDWVKTTFDLTIPWWIWSLVGVAYVAFLAYRGIQVSTRSMLILLAFEMAVMAVLAVWMLISAGTDAFTLLPFRPSAAGSGGFAAIGLAMTFGILSCVGIEEATTVAEETKQSRVAVARGVLLAAIVIPSFYIVTSYAMVVGLGPENLTGIPADAVPLQDAAVEFWGSGFGLSLVTVAVLSSILAFSQTGFNAGVRVLYALGREGLLPRGLGRTDRRYLTPYVSIVGLAVVIALLGWPLAAAVGPFNVWAYFGFGVSIMFLIVYLVVNLALIMDTRRSYATQFNGWTHGVVPIVGALAMAYPLYRVVFPLPPSPFPAIALLVLAWIVLGAIVLLVLRASRPDAISRAGLVMGELEVEEPQPGPAAPVA
jgi:amino acid transporter